MRALVTAALLLALPASAFAARTVMLRADPAKATTSPAAGEAVVVVLVDQRDRLPNTVVWQRYDPAAHALIVPDKADKTPNAFEVSLNSLIRWGSGSGLVAYVGAVPSGDYVLVGHAIDQKINSFCLGAPLFHVAAGSVSYVGTYRTIAMGRFANPLQHSALGWEGDLDKARAALTGFPALQGTLAAASISNGATFDCSGDAMWAYRVPGAPGLAGQP